MNVYLPDGHLNELQRRSIELLRLALGTSERP
jgi:hypothetical protein